MDREPVNKIKHVGNGGQKCNCCGISKRAIRGARRAAKRRAIREQKRDLDA